MEDLELLADAEIGDLVLDEPLAGLGQCLLNLSNAYDEGTTIEQQRRFRCARLLSACLALSLVRTSLEGSGASRSG